MFPELGVELLGDWPDDLDLLVVVLVGDVDVALVNLDRQRRVGKLVPLVVDRVDEFGVADRRRRLRRVEQVGKRQHRYDQAEPDQEGLCLLFHATLPSSGLQGTSAQHSLAPMGGQWLAGHPAEAEVTARTRISSARGPGVTSHSTVT